MKFEAARASSATSLLAGSCRRDVDRKFVGCLSCERSLREQINKTLFHTIGFNKLQTFRYQMRDTI